MDSEARPAYKNVELLARFADPQLTLELNRYNAEYNLTPVPATGESIPAMEREMCQVLERLNKLGDYSVIPIGILPTLRTSDFGDGAMTNVPRYHALAHILKQGADGKFELNIRGREEIVLPARDITFEGACTSFQIHYKMALADFVDSWNCAQLIVPIVLAISVNSPFIVGRAGWLETRVPVFKQAVDGRRERDLLWREPPRVNFGLGWLRRSPYELFARNVNLYPPLIPDCAEAEPLEQIARDEIPELDELRLHGGTIWSWNRAIYCPQQSGHLRIEMRALPAGPTPADMAANAALAIGLIEGLKNNIDDLINALPFSYAEYNFYRSAQFGLNAALIWPSSTQNGMSESPVCELIEKLLPVAEQGLAAIGVAGDAIKRYLGIICRRMETRQTGADWQLLRVDRLREKLPRDDALKQMVLEYRDLALSNTPVGEWPCP